MFPTLTVPFILSLLLMTILDLIISVYWQIHFYFLADFFNQGNEHNFYVHLALLRPQLSLSLSQWYWRKGKLMLYCLMSIVRLTPLTLTSYFILQVPVTLEMNFPLSSSANLLTILVAVIFSVVLMIAILSISYRFSKSRPRLFTVTW